MIVSLNIIVKPHNRLETVLICLAPFILLTLLIDMNMFQRGLGATLTTYLVDMGYTSL